MIKFLIFLSSANAEEVHHAAEAHGDMHAIPWGSLGVQAFNFAVLFTILFFLLRKATKEHFAHRASEYKKMVDRAESARNLAQVEHEQIRNRLEKLETSTEQNIEKAKQEAAKLRERMMVEAKALSEKLGQEAKRSAALEIDKARAELSQLLLAQSLDASRQSLKAKLGSSEQKKLHNEFVDKIQVVRE